LVTAGLFALGVPAPGRHGMRVALSGLALTAAVWMVHRIHRKSADRRAHAAPADRARLAVLTQVVLVVGELPERRAAVDMHLAGLARLQAQIRVNALARGVLRRAARAARELAAATGLELDVVHQ